MFIASREGCILKFWAIKVASIAFKAKHGEGGQSTKMTYEYLKAMNDPTTSYRKLKTRIRSPSRLGADRSKFLKGEGNPKIDQVQIFIEYHHWAKF